MIIKESYNLFEKPEVDTLAIDAQKTAMNWYGTTLPRDLESDDFINFVAKTWVMAQQVAPYSELKVMKSAPAAMTNGKTIWIPGLYFKENYYNERSSIISHVAAAVICVNGSQIHEALHCKLTNCNLPEWCRDNVKALHYFNNYIGFSVVLNLVEDVFIERYCEERYPTLSMFVEGKNNIMLGSVAAYEGFSRLYSDDASQDDLINALTLLKNKHHRDDDRWKPFIDIKSTMLKAVDPEISRDERLKIAIEVWELIIDAKDKDGNLLNNGSMTKIAPDGASPSTGGILSPEEVKLLVSSLKKIVEGKDNEQISKERRSGPSNENTGKEARNTNNETTVELNKAYQAKLDTRRVGSSGSSLADEDLNLKIGLIKIEADEFSPISKQIDSKAEEIIFNRGMGNVNIDNIPPLIIKDITKTDKKPVNLSPSKEYVSLGKALKYMRQAKHMAGQPRVSGFVIVKQRLARIATDGKIMAHKDVVNLSKGKPEVILLLDLSGSMDANGLIHKVSEAALGAFKSLISCQISVSVYGHTAIPSGRGFAPLLYAIASYNMPLLNRRLSSTMNYEKHFGLIPQVQHSQNFDGIAIKAVASKFTSKPGSKVLIVFSDGEPYGGADYSGQLAFQHTAQVIRDINKSGISVLSMSLNNAVMHQNTTLYKLGNLPAYGALLNRTLKDIVQVIASGKSLS